MIPGEGSTSGEKLGVDIVRTELSSVPELKHTEEKNEKKGTAEGHALTKVRTAHHRVHQQLTWASEEAVKNGTNAGSPNHKGKATFAGNDARTNSD